MFERHHRRGTTRHVKPHQKRAARNWARSHPEQVVGDLGVRARYVMREDGAYWVTSLSLEHVAIDKNEPRWNGLYVVRVS
jgi:hypothetical protein